MRSSKTPLLVLPLLSVLAAPLIQAKVATEPYTYIGHQQQQVAAEIGYFNVPENRRDPDSRQLTLSFVKFPSTSKTPKNPIVYLAGGPGGSATGTARRPRFELFRQLRAVSDVILFDQRGTGLSSDLEPCKSAPVDFAAPTDTTTAITHTKTAVKACVKQWQAQGIDLNGYTTKESAADLVALKQALGAEKLDLWGISYGTHLAFAAAKYHPEIIDQMVLASSEGLDHTIKRPARVDALINKVDAMLKANSATRSRYPALADTLTRVLTRLDRQPVVVESRDFRTKQPITVGIGKMDLQFALSYVLLSDPQYLKQMPRLIYAMDKGSYGEIAGYIAYIKSMANSHHPMSLAMDAASGISAGRWAQVQREAKSSYIGRTTNFPFPDINPVLPVGDLGDEFRREVESDIPTLFLAGTLDGRTLYQSQLELAANFTNASLLTIDGAGHNLYMSHPEIPGKIIDFLQGKPVPSQTLSLPPLEFQ